MPRCWPGLAGDGDFAWLKLILLSQCGSLSSEYVLKMCGNLGTETEMFFQCSSQKSEAKSRAPCEAQNKV